MPYKYSLIPHKDTNEQTHNTVQTTVISYRITTKNDSLRVCISFFARRNFITCARWVSQLK